jgi:hypothetical protein
MTTREGLLTISSSLLFLLFLCVLCNANHQNLLAARRIFTTETLKHGGAPQFAKASLQEQSKYFISAFGAQLRRASRAPQCFRASVVKILFGLRATPALWSSGSTTTFASCTRRPVWPRRWKQGWLTDHVWEIEELSALIE